MSQFLPTTVSVRKSIVVFSTRYATQWLLSSKSAGSVAAWAKPADAAKTSPMRSEAELIGIVFLCTQIRVADLELFFVFVLAFHQRLFVFCEARDAVLQEFFAHADDFFLLVDADVEFIF